VKRDGVGIHSLCVNACADDQPSDDARDYDSAALQRLYHLTRKRMEPLGCERHGWANPGGRGFWAEAESSGATWTGSPKGGFSGRKHHKPRLALNNNTAGVREREDANRTRVPGHLDEIQGVAPNILNLFRTGAVGFIDWLDAVMRGVPAPKRCYCSFLVSMGYCSRPNPLCAHNGGDSNFFPLAGSENPSLEYACAGSVQDR